MKVPVFKPDFARLSFADLQAIWEFSAHASDCYDDKIDPNISPERSEALSLFFFDSAFT